MVRVGRGFEFALLLAAQGELETQTNDTVTARRKALRLLLRLHAQWAIGLPALGVHRLNGDLQARILLCSLRRLVVRRCIEATCARRRTRGTGRLQDIRVVMFS